MYIMNYYSIYDLPKHPYPLGNNRITRTTGFNNATRKKYQLLNKHLIKKKHLW